MVDNINQPKSMCLSEHSNCQLLSRNNLRLSSVIPLMEQKPESRSADIPWIWRPRTSAVALCRPQISNFRIHVCVQHMYTWTINVIVVLLPPKLEESRKRISKKNKMTKLLTFLSILF
jgi:hypothetical protein